jgi:predicted PurR-regulated permease PerM
MALIVPPLVRQTRDFINSVPQTVENFQSQDTSLARAARKYHLDTKLTQAAHDFTSNHGNFGTTILDTGKRAAGAVVSLVAVIVLTFMMLVEGPKWFELAAGITRDKNRARFRRLSGRMYRAVSNFVNGQVILALVAGVFSFITLEVASNVMNVSISSLALAGIVAMLGIIPLFGNPSAAAIVCSVCLLSSWKLALVMLAYFVVYFFVENHTFQPYLQSRLNELTPLTVFVAALLGIGFGGFLGAIVAIPLASAVKILLEDYFERRSGKKTAPTEDLSITTA